MEWKTSIHSYKMKKSNMLERIYHVKSTEHDNNQLGLCSMLIAAVVKTVEGHTCINSKTNWLRSI